MNSYGLPAGTYFFGGDDVPQIGDTRYTVFGRWEVKSSAPCSVCQYLDGILIPNSGVGVGLGGPEFYFPKPHGSCTCEIVLDDSGDGEPGRFCKLTGRVSQGGWTKEEEVYVGIVSPGNSRTYTTSETHGTSAGVSGSGGGLMSSLGLSWSSTETRTDTVNAPADAEVNVYEVWEIEREDFIDTFDCGEITMQNHNVWSLRIRFLGLREK